VNVDDPTTLCGRSPARIERFVSVFLRARRHQLERVVLVKLRAESKQAPFTGYPTGKAFVEAESDLADSRRMRSIGMRTEPVPPDR